MRHFFLAGALSVCLATVSAAWAQHGAHDQLHAADARSATQTATAEGEVRKVDRATRRITLKHGELPGLGMGPMTMAFRIQDPAMLDRVKPGDKVRFSAARVGGAVTITAIEAVE